ENRNSDGVLVNAAGVPFAFELVYPQSSPVYGRFVEMLREAYAEAGIRMTPRPTEWSLLIERLSAKNFQAVTLGWSSGVETDIYQMFHSSQTHENGDNFVNYRSAELDGLIERARSTVDEAARMQLWRQCSRILYEDQPYTFLFRRHTLLFMNERIRNVTADTKLGLNNFVPVEWYIARR